MRRAGPAPLHVIDVGPAGAPAVILLHSIATHAALWAPQIPVWSARLRLLVVDLPGHGESPAQPQLATVEDYARLIAVLLDERQLLHCSIVGLSLGGMIGQAFALEYPQRLRSLVLANTSAQTPSPMRTQWEERKVAALRDGMVAQVSETLERWFPAEFAARSPITVAWVADMIRRTSPEGYGSAATAIQALSTFDRLHSIRCPVQVVCGGRDVATTPTLLRSLADQIPGARLETLEHAGHLSNLAQPVEFTERVGAFLLDTVRAGSLP